MSFEHAPPKSIGERELVLTCRDCNSSAGHRLDAELRKAVDHVAWWRGELNKPLRGRHIFEGVPLTVDMTRSPDLSISVVGIPEVNDPANTAAHTEAFQRLAAAGEPYREPMQFEFGGYRERYARIALLRSAYLTAFAVFGYRYIARRALEPVRRQIENPDDDIIGNRFSLHRRDPLAHRVVAWIERPRTLEPVIVQIDEHLVFLPGLKAGPSIYGRLAKRKRWPPDRRAFREMVPTTVGWPTRPSHRLDSAEAPPTAH